MVAEGEHETQDFKFVISDARKIARSISAFANHSGGRLLIGVKDNGTIAGVRNEEDIFVVEQAAERYCRPAQTVDFKAYRIEGGITVIIAEIPPAKSLPVYAGEPDGTWRAYYRVADENIVAHPLRVRGWELRSASDLPAVGHEHAVALDVIARRGSVADARELALSMHVSLQRAEDILALLAAWDLVDFTFDGSFFRLSHKAIPDT